MSETWGHCAKLNRQDKEKQIPYDLMSMWNIKKKKKGEIIDTEIRLLVARGGGGR